MDRLHLSDGQIDVVWEVLQWLETKGGREQLARELKDGRCYSFIDLAFDESDSAHWLSLDMTVDGELKLQVGNQEALSGEQSSLVDWARGELGGIWRVWKHDGRLQAGAAPAFKPRAPRLRLSALAERLAPFMPAA